MNLLNRAVIFSFVICGVVPVSCGQNVPVASLRGRVVDASHAPLPNSRVAIRADRRPAPPSVVSDQNGAFAFSLAPGNYTLNITRDGFQPAMRDVEVGVSGADVEIMLEIAPVNSAVTVNESTGYLNDATSSATKTPTPLQDVPQSITIINQSQIKDQMMMSIADVVNYVPGVTAIQGGKTTATNWSSGETAHRRTSLSTACATTSSSIAISMTSTGSKCSRGRTR
jgi:hypothetical protein